LLAEPSPIAVGQQARPHRNERICGDVIAVSRSDRLVAVSVVDGLGHGPLAAEAARAAADFVSAHWELDLADLFNRCHRHISGTRGVAMTVVRIDAVTLEMEHAGIGNVALTARSHEPTHPVPQPGILGVRLRKILPTRHQLHRGDAVAVFTDGISSRLDLDEYHQLDADRMAAAIVRNEGKDHDDAACAVLLV
jgi:hypothetical protein